MRQKIRWFSLLPFSWAFRLFLLYVIRRILRLEVGFSYSEFSEDLILNHIQGMGKGTYVDVGCNEPIHFSNTFSLYLSGWTGINIDANEELIRKCRRIRKKDISVCEAVSDQIKEVTFFQARNALVSTIDNDYYNADPGWWERNTELRRVVRTKTLTSILDEQLTPGRNIDLLSVDVEGHDLKVLQGLDFLRYRPKVIMVEMRDIENTADNEIHKFLAAKEYALFAFSVLTAIYIEKKSS